MLCLAIGEALKNIDNITGGALLSQYPGVDWKGATGFRDIIAHHYFDIDAEQVFWICKHELAPLSTAIEKDDRGFTLMMEAKEENRTGTELIREAAAPLD